MIVKDNIGTPGAAGVHMDKDNQPFALIASGNTLDEWSLTASHEMCEMLVDPSGDKQATGNSPKPGQERVSFLVEVCDPSEAADFAYSVNEILVSDFYTPHYFDPIAASGVRYSFTGAIISRVKSCAAAICHGKIRCRAIGGRRSGLRAANRRSATLVQPTPRRGAYGLLLIALRPAIPQRRLRADGRMPIRPALRRQKRGPRWRRMRQCGTTRSIPSWGGPRAVVQQEQRVGSVRAEKNLSRPHNEKRIAGFARPRERNVAL